MQVMGARSPRRSFTSHWSRVTKNAIQYGRSYACVCGSSNCFESWRSIFGYLHVLKMDIGDSRPYVQQTARNDRQSLARSILTPIIIFAERLNTDFLTKASEKRCINIYEFKAMAILSQPNYLFFVSWTSHASSRTRLTASDISR